MRKHFTEPYTREQMQSIWEEIDLAHVHMLRIFRKMNWWTVSDMLTCWAEKYILP